VVGDISQKEIVEKLSFLSKLTGREVKIPNLAAAPTVEKTLVYLIDVPKAARTEFRIGYLIYVAGISSRNMLRSCLVSARFSTRLVRSSFEPVEVSYQRIRSRPKSPISGLG